MIDRNERKKMLDAYLERVREFCHDWIDEGFIENSNRELVLQAVVILKDEE